MENKEKELWEQIGDKERALCDFYVTHWNATKAAIQAGYTEGSAHNSAKQVLKREIPRAYIAHLKSQAEELSGVSLLRNAQQLADIAYGLDTVKDAEGNDIEVPKFGVKDRAKAIELLNKMFGYYAPEQVDHGVTVNIPIVQWVKS